MDIKEIKEIVSAFMEGVKQIVAFLVRLFNKSSKEEETTAATQG